MKSTEIEDRRGLETSPSWFWLFKISSLLVSNSTSIPVDSYKAEKFSTAEKLRTFRNVEFFRVWDKIFSGKRSSYDESIEFFIFQILKRLNFILYFRWNIIDLFVNMSAVQLKMPMAKFELFKIFYRIKFYLIIYK